MVAIIYMQSRIKSQIAEIQSIINELFLDDRQKTENITAYMSFASFVF